MTRTCLLSSFALIVSAGLASTAMADDLSPPAWRFTPGSTVQHWDFSGGAGGGIPDAGPLNNPFGVPVMVPTVGSNWLPFIAGRNHVWDITGGALQFDIPNTGNTVNQKNIQIQVTYLGLAPTVGPGYVVASNFGLFTPVGAPIITALPGGWIHEVTNWNLGICPPFERISIFPSLAGVNMILDQVVIDTQCIPIPGPATASLLALGGLCAIRRRRA